MTKDTPRAEALEWLYKQPVKLSILKTIETALSPAAQGDEKPTCYKCGGTGYYSAFGPTCCGNVTDNGECRAHCAVPEETTEQCDECPAACEATPPPEAVRIEGLEEAIAFCEMEIDGQVKLAPKQCKADVLEAARPAANDALLPCPFCGRPAKLDSAREGKRWRVHCELYDETDSETDCPCNVELRSFRDTRKEAIDAWNTRADLASRPQTDTAQPAQGVDLNAIKQECHKLTFSPDLRAVPSIFHVINVVVDHLAPRLLPVTGAREGGGKS